MSIKHPLPPSAKQVPFLTTLHGETREDPYAWLRDPQWEAVIDDPSLLSSDIHSYLTEENAYTDAILGPTAALEETLRSEMRGRIEEAVTYPAFPDGAFSYYSRQVPGGEYMVYCRKSTSTTDAPEEILFDGNEVAKGQAHFSLGTFTHSPDHQFVLYTIDTSGSERYRLFVKRIATGEILSDSIDQVADALWANDSAHFFYTKVDEQHRPQDVFVHTLGTSDSADELVYRPTTPGFFVSLQKTLSGAWVVVNVEDHDSSEAYVIPASGVERTPVLVAARRPGVRYSVFDHPDGYFLILTNADGAEDFAIMRVGHEELGTYSWKEFVPHRAGVLIREIIVFRDFVVRLEVAQALPRIVIRDRSGEEHAIVFAEEAYSLDLLSGFVFDTEVVRFVYSSPTTPPETFDYDMATRTRTLLRRVEVPSGHDPKDYVVKRLFAKSHDGASVPVTLLTRSDLQGAPRPCLLYGYGAYGIPMDAYWSSRHLSLVDHGVTFVIAHVRGGTDLGYRWYLDGKMMQKKNTFLDFIAVAELLVAEGYAAPRALAMEGRSAGGMLVGTVLNMRPELFTAVVAGVPFVDVLNTMSDGSLPLTPMEWNEWGNPISSKEAYDYMKSYSPYDNVVRQAYPHVLVTAGVSDPRVTYWEPAKWVAKLRFAQQGNGVILLRTEMEHGHQGSTGRFKSLGDDARIYAFVIAALRGDFDEERS